MTFSRLICMLGMLLLLCSCGGRGESTLGTFGPITKTEGDAPFTLTAPKSNSPGGFTYTSSDPSVATVSGNIVTILRAGTTTITATQDGVGSFSTTSTSAVLTVAPRTCTAPLVNQNGVCVQVPTCIAPANLQNNVCVAPATAGNFVSRSGRTWSPAAFINNWTDANAYCTTTTINGQTGWKLPTEFELSDLFMSGSANGQGWVLAQTWASTPSVNSVLAVIPNTHRAVDLSNGSTSDKQDANGAYITCIR